MLSQTDQEPNAACITLRRAGYYTIPPIDKLEEYVCGDTCIVPNFTVGRKGYGNVYFPDPFDIYGLNLDEIGEFFISSLLALQYFYSIENNVENAIHFSSPLPQQRDHHLSRRRSEATDGPRLEPQSTSHSRPCLAT